MNCPFCGQTGRYTDPALQVRCSGCFNPLNDEAPGVPMGRYQDTMAPMVIGSHSYPQPVFTKWGGPA